MSSVLGSPNLKILIASTPRSGNTWLKLLLSEIYNLPIVSLTTSFDEARYELSTDRWVAHQHYYPQPHLLSWAKQKGVHLLTMVRHPADTLLSLVHYLRNLPPAFSPEETGQLPRLDGEVFGPETIRFVEREFSSWLGISVGWVLARASLVVRYEDLRCGPLATLSALTSKICPIPQPRIKRAIAMCEFDKLHTRSELDAKFFRSGRIGEGRIALPPSMLNILSSREPYISQYAILGYEADREGGSSEYDSLKYPQSNPFTGHKSFDNGIPVPYLATELYVSVDGCQERWPEPLGTKRSDSFYAWLNRRADDDPLGGSPRVITNMAAYVYRIRPDVQIAFPEPFHGDREAFADWFVSDGAKEHFIPAEFVEPVKTREQMENRVIPRRTNSRKQPARRKGNLIRKGKSAKPL